MLRKVVSMPNQTVFDIASQYYGDVAHFDRVLELNPVLYSDYTYARELGVQVDESLFDISYPLMPNTHLNIDVKFVNRGVLRELQQKEIVSFSKNDVYGAT